MAKFSTYTPATARRVLRDIAELQRRPFPDALGRGAEFVRGPLVTRWGKTTTTVAYPTYPTSGNVVAVRLGDYTPYPIYPGATAANTFTAYDPAVDVYAITTGSTLPAIGTVVEIVWRNGQWWMDSPHEYTEGEIGGSNYYWPDGGSKTAASTVEITSTEIKLWPVVTGFTNPYTIITDPAARTDNWIVPKNNDTAYNICIHLSLWSPPLSQADAETYLRAAAHTHTYTDDGVPSTTGSTTVDCLDLESPTPMGVKAEISVGSGASTIVYLTLHPRYYYDSGSEPYYDWVHATIKAHAPVGVGRAINFKLQRINGNAGEIYLGGSTGYVHRRSGLF